MKPTKSHCRYIVSILNEEEDTEQTHARLHGMGSRFSNPFLLACADLLREKTFSEAEGFLKFEQAIRVFEQLIGELEEEGLLQYLDTTVLIDFFKTRQRRIEIETALFGCKVVICWHSLMEFCRVLGNPLKILYNLSTIAESWNDVRALAADYFAKPGSGNFQKICLLIENLIPDPSKEDLRLCQIRLKNWIVVELELRIRELVADIIQDGVMCSRIVRLDADGNPYLVRASIREGKYQLLSCNRKTATCNIEEFIDANRSNLNSVREYLARSPKPDKQMTAMITVLQKVLEDGKTPKGQKHCWKIGDVIICFAAPVDSFIRTRNVDHFEPICDAIGKRARLMKL